MIDASRKTPLSEEEYEKIADALDQWFTSQSIDERDAAVAMVHLTARLIAKHTNPFAALESINDMRNLLMSIVVNKKLSLILGSHNELHR